MNIKLVDIIIFLGLFSLISMGTIFYYSIVDMHSIKQKFQDTLNNEAIKVSLSKDIKINLLSMQRAESNLITEQNETENKKYQLCFEQAKNELEINFFKLKSLIKTQFKEIEDFQNHYNNYIKQFETLSKPIKTSSINSINHIDKTMNDNISKIIQYNEMSIKNAVQTTNKEYDEYLSFIKILSTALVIFLVIFLVFIYLFVTKRLRSIYNLTDYIKSGDFIKNLHYKPVQNNDELGLIEASLYESILLLQKHRKLQNGQNWIKSSIIELSSSLNDKHSLLEITQSALSTICRKIDAGMGIIYLYEDNLLKRHATYAYTNKFDSAKEIALGEGVVGQVGLEQKAILLTNVQDVSNTIKTGITNSLPLHTFTYPLVYKGELQGVIELASLLKITQVEQEYLNRFVESFSAIIYASKKADETQKLLKTTQFQAQELEQSQQELELQAQELEQNNTELIMRQKEIEKKVSELETSNKYKSEFLANMSHELRTPLNSINILSKILTDNKDGNLTEKQVQQAMTIYNSGKDLLQLINDILDLSKIEAKMMHLHLSDVSMDALTHKLHELFEPLAKQKEINLELNIEQLKENIIYSDKIKIQQIMKNFISNALKFTPQHGKVILKLNNNIGENSDTFPLQFSVIDTGIGVHKDNLATIFEVFRQADGSISREYAGTGLGLSISKELATMLDAKITVESVLGYGSIFSLLLPYTIDIKKIDKNFLEIVPLNEEKKIIHQQPDLFIQDDRLRLTKEDKILLIIEDDIKFANIVKDEAKKLSIKTIIATNGKEGLEFAQKYQPSGIILDMNLPIMDGLDVLKLLKADTTTRHIPVKIMSIDEPNMATQRMGAINYLQKPIEPEALQMAINKLILKNKKEKKDLLIVEDNEILRENLSTILRADDINILSARNAKDAIFSAELIDFDCAIVDIGLPDMTGFQLLKILKRTHCNLPIIIYSARDFNSDELKVLREYSESIIIKTVESEERLIQETSLFLHRLHKNLSESHKNILKASSSLETIFNNKKVLIVDDDIRNTFALDSILSNQGMQTIIASNGEEALKRLKEHEDINIILMDIMMPVMNGYETIQTIRKDSKYTPIPIIALTAKAQKEDRQKCLDIGANDYISKPIDNEHLLQLIKVWIRY